MHASESATLALPRAGLTSYEPCVIFAPNQNVREDQRVIPIINELQEKGQLYYGIEIMARRQGKPVCLDFNSFLPVLPIFVSIAWLGVSYWNVNPIDKVDSLVLAKHLAPHIPVMPHLSAYRMTEKRLDEFLAQKFSNVLALRGDLVDRAQEFDNSLPIVKKAIENRADMSVCVAGHPEGFPGAKGYADAENQMESLRKKVNLGAGCIITQVCYKSELIIKFVKDIRAAIPGKQVPIMVGIMIHETVSSYEKMEELTGATLPLNLSRELQALKLEKLDDPQRIRSFSVRLNMGIIRDILKADISVWGFQFFTLNNFKGVEETLAELHKENLFHREKLLPYPSERLLNGKEYE